MQWHKSRFPDHRSRSSSSDVSRCCSNKLTASPRQNSDTLKGLQSLLLGNSLPAASSDVLVSSRQATDIVQVFSGWHDKGILRPSLQSVSRRNNRSDTWNQPRLLKVPVVHAVGRKQSRSVRLQRNNTKPHVYTTNCLHARQCSCNTRSHVHITRNLRTSRGLHTSRRMPRKKRRSSRIYLIHHGCEGTDETSNRADSVSVGCENMFKPSSGSSVGGNGTHCTVWNHHNRCSDALSCIGTLRTHHAARSQRPRNPRGRSHRCQ